MDAIRIDRSAAVPAVRPQGHHYDVIVMGAGPAGISAADTLVRSGRSVLVIDGASDVGGTHRSHEIAGMTFDVGSIFYEDQARLFAQFPEVHALCVPVRRVQKRIAPDGQVLHYPLEPRDILAWPKGRLARAVADLVWSRLSVRRDGTVDAACRARLGGAIYRGSGLRDYIARFHHMPPESIDEEFFFRRMSFIEKKTRASEMASMLWRAARRKSVRKGPPAALCIRPASGFASFFAPIRTALERRGVTFRLQTPVTRVTRDAEGFTVQAGQGVWTAGAVVSAMPVDLCHRAVFGEASGLQSLDLMTLFVSAGTLDPRLGNVLFNFHKAGRWKRLTVYSRLYPALHTGRDFFSVEVTLPHGAAPDPEAAFADTGSHLTGLGLVSDDLVLEGHAVVRDAYPLYLKGRADAARPVLARLTAFGILSVGRQGRFEYLPTASGVLRRVAEELSAAQDLPARTAP